MAATGAHSASACCALPIAPTMYQTRLARTEPHRTEAAGGPFVATFQFSIALGAALGGMLLDAAGVQTVFLAGGVGVLIGGAPVASTRLNSGSE
jgi:predicted MFS family arabinose efflux permease